MLETKFYLQSVVVSYTGGPGGHGRAVRYAWRAHGPRAERYEPGRVCKNVTMGKRIDRKKLKKKEMRKKGRKEKRNIEKRKERINLILSYS